MNANEIEIIFEPELEGEKSLSEYYEKNGKIIVKTINFQHQRLQSTINDLNYRLNNFGDASQLIYEQSQKNYEEKLQLNIVKSIYLRIL